MMVTNYLSCLFPFHLIMSWFLYDSWKVLLLGISVWVDMFYFVLYLKNAFSISGDHMGFVEKFSSFGLFCLYGWSAIVRYHFFSGYLKNLFVFVFNFFLYFCYQCYRYFFFGFSMLMFFSASQICMFISCLNWEGFWIIFCFSFVSTLLFK